MVTLRATGNVSSFTAFAAGRSILRVVPVAPARGSGHVSTQLEAKKPEKEFGPRLPSECSEDHCLEPKWLRIFTLAKKAIFRELADNNQPKPTHTTPTFAPKLPETTKKRPI